MVKPDWMESKEYWDLHMQYAWKQMMAEAGLEWDKAVRLEIEVVVRDGGAGKLWKVRRIGDGYFAYLNESESARKATKGAEKEDTAR